MAGGVCLACPTERRGVPARALAARGAAGGVWQRVRARAAAQPRWARRHLLLTHNLLYAYRTPEVSAAPPTLTCVHRTFQLSM